MSDICLLFTDELQAQSVLYMDHTLTNNADLPDGSPTAHTAKYQNIDLIGTIYRPGPVSLNSDGLEELSFTAMPGYAVNVLTLPGEDEAALAPYIITPTRRQRVWA